MVHANSVIPLWLKTYNQQAYDKLTDQENYAYTAPGADQSNLDPGFRKSQLVLWMPQFLLLADSLTSWKNVNRQQLLIDSMPVVCSYITMTETYGYDKALISSMDAKKIFNIGGFIDACISRPTNFYDDMPAPGGEVTNTDGTTSPAPAPASTKLTADITMITGASAKESSTLSSVKSTALGIISVNSHKMFFEEVQPVGYITKDELTKKIFKDLGFEKVYRYLNIGALKVPSSI